jgi:hypothetical protein
MSFEQSALFHFVSDRNARLQGAIIGLREQIGSWLSYTVTTFPHYTSHGVDHSDEIVMQLSRLLFTDTGSLVIAHLSAVEAYVLMAAAFVHDAGMVVNDAEKRILIGSPHWTDWLEETNRVDEWTSIQALRDAPTPVDPAVRHYLADLRTRYVLSEYFRARHHLRSQTLVQDLMPSITVDLGDPLLPETIGVICAGHGLRSADLDDPQRFPFRRDILDETVNVRLCAILLRLGDLLDMRTERACPLMLGAASPLPSDSYPHWSQYQRITNKSTTPYDIHIQAACDTSAEFALLQDWCNWIAEEVKNAPGLLAHSTRHEDWRPPNAKLDGPSATMQISTAPGATFIPCKWKFELEPDAVFDRLIRDAYSYPLQYVKELVQNGLDAMRCKMYSDLQAEGKPTPVDPSSIDEAIRAKYALRITLTDSQSTDAVIGDTPRTQVLTVDDSGIGMDADTITRFLLQVGKSYYQTAQFKRDYEFVPVSRFGVGFLAVFSVSEHVIVETFRQDSLESLRLTLTRPKSFLLLEKGNRQRTGTSVSIRLLQPLTPGSLTEEVRRLCRRVEFPIFVTEGSRTTEVIPEGSEQFVFKGATVLNESGTHLECRPFPIALDGVRGELYVLVSTTEKGENWTRYRHLYGHLSDFPSEFLPAFPDDLVAVQGLTMFESGIHRLRPELGYAQRIDVRSRDITVSLGRNEIKLGQALESSLQRCRFAIVSGHLRETALARGPDTWRYKQRLIEAFGLLDGWANEPGTARVFRDGHADEVTLEWLKAQPSIVTLLRFASGGRVYDQGYFRQAVKEAPEALTGGSIPKLWHHDIAVIDEQYMTALMEKRRPVAFDEARDDDIVLSITWQKDAPPPADSEQSWRAFLLDFSSDKELGANTHFFGWHFYLINIRHPLVQWWLLVCKSDFAANMTERMREGFAN